MHEVHAATDSLEQAFSCQTPHDVRSRPLAGLSPKFGKGDARAALALPTREQAGLALGESNAIVDWPTIRGRSQQVRQAVYSRNKCRRYGEYVN
jgi:hypothetical protein